MKDEEIVDPDTKVVNSLPQVIEPVPQVVDSLPQVVEPASISHIPVINPSEPIQPKSKNKKKRR